MSAIFTPCSVAGCPRDTAGYCPKCDWQAYAFNSDRYREGFQAGLKKAAEIASPHKDIIPRNQWMKGYQTGREEVQQAILKMAHD